jgi:hypothetical protein
MLAVAIADTRGVVGRSVEAAQPGPEVWRGLETSGRRPAR